MTKRYLTFDIETISLDMDTFSESQREFITRYAKTPEDEEKKISEMALSPLTAQAIVIGMQISEKKADDSFIVLKRGAYAMDDKLADGERIKDTLSTGDECYFSNEKTLLEQFWLRLKENPNIHLVSFNGRNFDAPFLMLRSALLGIKPTRNLMQGTKFNYDHHTDLIDELTFYNPGAYGATKRFNFDFYTRAFGLVSPKSGGIDGSKVKDFYLDGKIKEIADYCLRDVTATWDLYKVWYDRLTNFDKPLDY
jgi:DNA polymerase elongation subunit (family B)